MRRLDELFHTDDQIIDTDSFRGGRHRRAGQADVDDPLKNDDVFDVRLIERVMIEASQAVDAKFHSSRRRIMKNPIAYDSRVQHAERETLLQ